MSVNRLTDILDRSEIQALQDRFSEITGVASVLTDINGVPITEFSGFCKLCTAIREHPDGKASCREINARYCTVFTEDPEINHCPQLGLWEAGAKIFLGDNHIGNWIVGQLRPDEFDLGKILRYTESLGLDRGWVLDSLEEITTMDRIDFKMILEILELFTNQLSSLAYRKHLLKREMSEKNILSRQLNYLSYYDPLTGLINREITLDRVRHLMATVKRTPGKSFSLLMISPKDLTHQMEVYGNNGVRQIVKYTSDIIKQSVRMMDTVGQYSMDEFLILLESSETEEGHPERIYDRIRDALNTRFLLDGSLLKIQIHGGMVEWNSDSEENADELIRKCYTALQEARKKDTENLFFYSDDLYQSVKFENELEKNFEQALINEEILPYYQPIIRMEKGESYIYGYEVLARWKHPEYGVLSPGLFIPLAEKHNIMGDLSEYLIRHASRFIKDINISHSDSPLFISVNITPEEFVHKNFINKISRILQEEELPGSWIKLEITENSVLKGGEESLDKIKALNALGISLSMDDFGTGYSNLSLLCRLPLNNIKLDQSLISMSEENENFIQAIISLARSLDMEIIAEGVEKESQIEILNRMGCHIHQGFYYGHPMDGETVKSVRFANSPVSYI